MHFCMFMYGNWQIKLWNIIESLKSVGVCCCCKHDHVLAQVSLQCLKYFTTPESCSQLFINLFSSIFIYTWEQIKVCMMLLLLSLIWILNMQSLPYGLYMIDILLMGAYKISHHKYSINSYSMKYLWRHASLCWYIQWKQNHFASADSRLAPSQWETSLQSNTISYWLGASIESALCAAMNHSLLSLLNRWNKWVSHLPVKMHTPCINQYSWLPIWTCLVSISTIFPQTIKLSTKVFCPPGPNLVILALNSDKLSRGQAPGWRTDGLIDRQMQAMTMPEGQNWPQVIMWSEFGHHHGCICHSSWWCCAISRHYSN